MELIIDPNSLPPEGLDLEGTLPASVFALEEGDTVRPASPLEYQLHVDKDDEGLIITGNLAATFDLECGRCTEHFQHRVEVGDYAQQIPLESGTVDLTNHLREDILLALPSYPRCEDGNVTPRECPAEGRFDANQDDEAPEAQDPHRWDALDQLTNLKKN